MPKVFYLFIYFIVTVDRQVQLPIVKDFNKGFHKRIRTSITNQGIYVPSMHYIICLFHCRIKKDCTFFYLVKKKKKYKILFLKFGLQ